MMKKNRLVEKIENLANEIDRPYYSAYLGEYSHGNEEYMRKKRSSLRNEINNLVKDAIEGTSTNETKVYPYTQLERVDFFEKLRTGYFSKYELSRSCFQIDDDSIWTLYNSLKYKKLKNRVIANCGIDFTLFASRIAVNSMIESKKNSKEFINFIELCVKHWDRIKDNGGIHNSDFYKIIKLDSLNDEKRKDYIGILGKGDKKFPMTQYLLALDITDISLFIEAISMICYKEFWSNYDFTDDYISKLTLHIVKLENPNKKEDIWKMPPSDNVIKFIKLIRNVDVGDDPHLISIRNECQLQVAQFFSWNDFFNLLQYVEPSDELSACVEQIPSRNKETEEKIARSTMYFKSDEKRLNIGKTFKNSQNVLIVISFMDNDNSKKDLIFWQWNLLGEEEICAVACKRITDDRCLYEIAQSLSNLELVKSMMQYLHDSYYLFLLIYDKFPNLRQQLQKIVDSSAKESVRVLQKTSKQS